MQLGSSIGRRRGRDPGDPEPRGGGSRKGAKRGKSGGRGRLLLVAMVLAGGGFGGGWLYATTTLFPPPPPPGDLAEVPDLHAVGVDEASLRVTRAGLELGTVHGLGHSTLDSGRIVGQDPLPGQLARPGSPVRVTVSLGPQRTLVPDVSQLLAGRALEVLEATGFVVVVDSVPSNEPRGRVVSIQPVPGTFLSVPGQVRLAVSSGPSQLVMPFLIGMTEAEARATIEALGLVLLSVQDDARPGAEPGRVVGQSPSSEEFLEAGSAVRIFVTGSAPTRDTIPGP